MPDDSASPNPIAATVAREILGAVDGLVALRQPAYLAAVARAAELLLDCVRRDGRIYIFGNGGSASDAQHIAAELIGRYKTERRPIGAVALTTDTSVLTAWSNDYEYETVFARQLAGLARPGDIAWGLSTSGNSPNVLRAFEVAADMGVHTLALTGRSGGRMAEIADCAVVVPLTDTPRIQEAHLITYHTLCEVLDHAFDSAGSAA